MDGLVAHQDAVTLGVDGLSGGGGIPGRNAGHQVDVIVDERLAAQGELLPVGFELAGGPLGVGGDVALQLSALRHLQELPDRSGQIVVVVDLEILQAPLLRPEVEGNGDLLVALDIRLVDGVVQDGGEGCGGVVILPGANLPEQVIVAHAAGVGDAAALQALDSQIPQGHGGKPSGTLGGVLKGYAAPEQKALGGVPSEFILSGFGNMDAGGNGAAVGPQLLQDSRSDVVHAGALVDVALRVDAEVPADGHNIRDPLPLRLHGLSGGVAAGGSGGGGRHLGLSAAQAAVAAIGGGVPTLIVAIGVNVQSEGVDLPLKGVDLGLFLRGQVPICGLGCVDKLQLPLDFGRSLFALHSCLPPKSVQIVLKLALVDVQRDRSRLLRFTAHADRPVCWHRNDRNFKGPPLPRNFARSGEAAIGACLSGHYFLNGINAVPDRNAFQRPGLYFLKYDLRRFVGVELDLCVASAAVQPCPVDLPNHLVPVMVEQ